ncbi:FecR family protein [Dyadobacter koreensis]|uniref:FecR family protein n=1 Tax=Dyadobacter koreensis TaxID=408657 RepID=A0A1H6QQZ9_9BACT|nr:FecR domain-containing protein [Dyadobacter koreensis]SEI41665.1 FecR family protein [Dyadobacter koreensis]
MIDPDFLDRLVERYYTNSATAEELEVFIHLQKTGVLDEALNLYLEKIIQQEAFQTKEVAERKIRRSWNWQIAASISVLMGFLALWIVKEGQSQYLEIKTDRFKEKIVVLPDGSRVTLNRNSVFSYPEKWNGTIRDVRLISGEAFFEVKKNKQYPSFVVHTPDGLDINVLGTEFNVLNKKGDTRIYLQNGKVKIKTQNQEVFLEPGQLASFNGPADSLTVKPASGELWLAWKNDMFYFDDTRLSDISLVLEEYYHRQVIIKNESLTSLRFTGKISRNNIDMVLRILSRTLNVEITQHNEQIIIEDSGKVNPLAD